MRVFHKNEAGLTLIEILVVTVIFAIMVVSYLAFFGDALLFGRRLDHRRFAIQKTISMMEEIRSFVESGAENQIDLLDDFDDGDGFNPILTTNKDVEEGDDPLSDNEPLGQGWRFYRKIRVEKLEDEESKDLRRVSITIFQSQDGTPGGVPRADVAGIFRTLASPLPPTQVMDIYVVAIENIPGWWVNMTTLRPLVENAFGDLESANPGLKFRSHWITRLSYGRDRYYAPQVNVKELASEAINQVYFYPGRINRQGFRYYSPDLIRGKISVDQTIRNMDTRSVDFDLAGYTLADQFNSAMRFPDEVALYEKRRDAGLDRELSWRLLLDDLNANPQKYRNALIINLHGELLPLPPVRNYSDAARKPLDHPNVRVVTHPEKLRVEPYEPVRLRVYPYVVEPDSVSAAATFSDVTVLIRGIRDLGPIRIRKIQGGGGKAYKYSRLKSEKIGRITGKGVALNLKDVPLRHGGGGGAGLPKNQRLYGLEYIPAPVGPKNNFSVNLVSSGNRPKNTARYEITLPSSALPKKGLLTIETRLGEDNTRSGENGFEPENLSRTFVWIGEDPPLSEQFQLIGDPRHLPYQDVKERGGYNWYFRQIPAASGYSGYEKTADGWTTEESVDLNVPRYFQMVRKALLKTNAVFTTMTGFSFYYLGVGGEIGSDRPNGFPDGLPVAGRAYGKRGTAMVRSITEGVQTVRAGRSSWTALPWVGELYPDKRFRGWKTNGNLSAGKNPGQFYRVPFSQAPKYGNTFDRKRRTDVYGSASFFNARGSKEGPFNHIYSKNNWAIATAAGSELETIYNFPIQEKLKAIRPFTLDYNDNYPPEWNDEIFSSIRNRTAIMKTFYGATKPRKAHSSGLIHLYGTEAKDSAYFVVNGLSPAGETGTTYIGRYALLTLLQGYFLAGSHPLEDYRIPQLPLIRISSPKESADLVNVSRVNIKWDVRWLRWDYQPYSAGYEKDFSENTPLFFAVKYSPDEGQTWYLASSNEETRPGVLPPDEDRVSDPEFDWNLETKEGNYVVRVEAFRAEIPLHYAFHQIGLSLKRKNET